MIHDPRGKHGITAAQVLEMLNEAGLPPDRFEPDPDLLIRFHFDGPVHSGRLVLNLGGDLTASADIIDAWPVELTPDSVAAAARTLREAVDGST